MLFEVFREYNNLCYTHIQFQLTKFPFSITSGGVYTKETLKQMLLPKNRGGSVSVHAIINLIYWGKGGRGGRSWSNDLGERCPWSLLTTNHTDIMIMAINLRVSHISQNLHLFTWRNHKQVLHTLISININIHVYLIFIISTFKTFRIII